MKLTSKIKDFIGEELMELIGAVCDLRKIGSNQEKMEFMVRLLTTYGKSFTILGGATNRLAVLINGYVFKLALDNQGVKDNMIEYAISSELQPFVTKSYETNGYILVAEYVTVMTIDKFQARKTDILKVLSLLADSYLLGDVGYDKKNYTNWGMRDDGSVVILDYAYIHRATEQLFKCDKCGEGLLTYDANYTMLLCTNRASGCNARYTYNERKALQGEQVDIDMVEESKNRSIVIKQGEMSQDVTESDNGYEFYGDDVIVVHNRYEYERAMAAIESEPFRSDYDQNAGLNKLVEIALAGGMDNAETACAELRELTSDPASKKKRIVLADDYTEETVETKRFDLAPSYEFLMSEEYPNSPYNLGIVDEPGIPNQDAGTTPSDFNHLVTIALAETQASDEEVDMYKEDIDQRAGFDLLVDVANSGDDIETRETVVSLSNNVINKKEDKEMSFSGGYVDPEAAYEDDYPVTFRYDDDTAELEQEAIEQAVEEEYSDSSNSDGGSIDDSNSFNKLVEMAKAARQKELALRAQMNPAPEDPAPPEVVVDGVVHQ